jgi:succinate dehydrogenase / fumarate reductase, cytochrome b subunit
MAARSASASPAAVSPLGPGRALTSSVFLKAVMAVSGFVWLGFLVGHLGSNLHLFAGAASMNGYYAGLKANAVIFWGVRVALIGSVAAHIAAAYVLARRSQAARPLGYRVKRNLATSYAGLTMRWSGPLLGVFIVYHLLHFTVGVAMPAGAPFVEGDDYGNIVRSFSGGYAPFVYIGALALLSFHLWHGAAAGTLSLGARHPQWDRRLRIALACVVMIAVGGFLSMPVAVWLGIVR